MYDVIIIGGGPGGSACGSFLAQKGLKVLIVEKEKFPRFHVGEALVPAANKALNEIGYKDIDKVASIVKYGAIWTSQHKPTYETKFDKLDKSFVLKGNEKLDLDFPQVSYHVKREDFDKSLLDHAQKQGCEIIQDLVINVDFDKKEVVCKENKFSFKYVIDASGRSTVLGKQLKLKKPDPIFKQNAIHAWFEDYKYDEKEFHYTNIHFTPIKNMWLWQIQIEPSVTSLGLVYNPNSVPKDSMENIFWNYLKEQRKDIYDRLENSKLIRDFKRESNFSYSMDEFCGEDWIMIGDAARFIDPIFSSGVSIALNSGVLAAKAILNKEKSGESFDEFKNTCQKAHKTWRNFILLYYKLNILFTYFAGDARFSVELLEILQGDVYKEKDYKLLHEWKKMIEQIESNPKHPLYKHISPEIKLTDI